MKVIYQRKLEKELTNKRGLTLGSEGPDEIEARQFVVVSTSTDITFSSA